MRRRSGWEVVSDARWALRYVSKTWCPSFVGRGWTLQRNAHPIRYATSLPLPRITAGGPRRHLVEDSEFLQMLADA